MARQRLVVFCLSALLALVRAKGTADCAFVEQDAYNEKTVHIIYSNHLVRHRLHICAGQDQSSATLTLHRAVRAVMQRKLTTDTTAITRTCACIIKGGFVHAGYRL